MVCIPSEGQISCKSFPVVRGDQFLAPFETRREVCLWRESVMKVTLQVLLFLQQQANRFGSKIPYRRCVKADSAPLRAESGSDIHRKRGVG